MYLYAFICNYEFPANFHFITFLSRVSTPFELPYQVSDYPALLRKETDILIFLQ